ncbi:MAG: hypothetical protein ACTHNU_04650 [Gaiellales bacterium]
MTGRRRALDEHLIPAYKRYRWSVRSHWARHRSYLWASRLSRGRAVVGADTELVIEGFPRSANTFAAVAFQLAQPTPVRLAHHVHAASQVIAAVRAGVPAIVLVRDPRDAVPSQLIRAPHLPLDLVLDGYARFYEPLLPLRDRLVVAPFDDVLRDFGGVVDEVNRRFGTAFARSANDPDDVARVNALIDEQSLRGPWERTINDFVSGRITLQELERRRPAAGVQPEVSEARVSRPSEHRRQRRDEILAAYQSAPLAAARVRAERAFQAFAGEPRRYQSGPVS